ncbi:hypothetical protein LCGC14_3153910, partial [marine sediment metagenome]
TRIVPGGKKHILIMPFAGIQKGVPGVNRIAARRIGQVIKGQGIKKIIAQMDKSPLTFLRNIRKLKPADKAMFLRNIATAPGGKKVAAAIQKDSIAALMKAMPQAQRQAWRKMLKGAPRKFKWILATGTAVLGTEFMVGWLRKEATEPLGIGTWALIKERRWREALEATKLQKKFLDAANNSWVATILENFPVLGPMFKINREEQYAANELFAKTAEDMIKKEPEATARLILDGTPSSANVYIAGSFYGKLAGFTAELPTGPHSILIDLKGYVARRLDIVLDPKEIERHRVDLEISPATVFVPYKRASSTQKAWVKETYPAQYNNYKNVPDAWDYF